MGSNYEITMIVGNVGEDWNGSDPRQPAGTIIERENGNSAREQLRRIRREFPLESSFCRGALKLTSCSWLISGALR